MFNTRPNARPNAVQLNGDVYVHVRPKKAGK